MVPSPDFRKWPQSPAELKTAQSQALLGTASPRSSASPRAKRLGLLSTVEVLGWGERVLVREAKRSFADMRSQAELGTEEKTRTLFWIR